MSHGHQLRIELLLRLLEHFVERFLAAHRRPVRALGQAGDVLLLVGDTGQAGNLLAAADAAHERDMTVIALTGARGGALAGRLRDTDVHICVPNERTARIQEVHLLAIHCICDGVDAQLLGDGEDNT